MMKNIFLIDYSIYKTWLKRHRLFLPDKDVYRRACERPVLANLVLEETSVRLLDVLWQVGVEHERRYLRVGQLRAILNLDILTLYRWWRICLYKRQHNLVELGGSYLCLAVEINLLGCFEHLEYALLCECRRKDIGKSVNGAMRLRMAVTKVSITF